MNGPRSLLSSVRNAVHGVYVAFRDERNMRIHGVLTVFVLSVAIWLKVSVQETMMILLCIAIVWIAELFNTAIEESFDLQTSKEHPQVKVGKDVAAGAVLIASLFSGVIGAIILLPKLWSVFL